MTIKEFLIKAATESETNMPESRAAAEICEPELHSREVRRALMSVFGAIEICGGVVSGFIAGYAYAAAHAPEEDLDAVYDAAINPTGPGVQRLVKSEDKRSLSQEELSLCRKIAKAHIMTAIDLIENEGPEQALRSLKAALKDVDGNAKVTDEAHNLLVGNASVGDLIEVLLNDASEKGIL